MNALHRCLSRLRRRALPALALFVGLSSPMLASHAADALNGKSLYLNGPVGGGTTCASCHGPSPADNVNGILAAVNKPDVITSAFAANLGGMGTLFNGRFTASEIADLAAFIGNPNVSAAPAASVSPASLNFPATTISQPAAPVGTTLTNTGNATLNIATLSLTGAAAGDYAISGGTCANGGTLAAGASCTVQIAFKPTAAGARDASLVIAHNATGNSSTVALSGAGNTVPQATIALSANALDFGAQLSGVASPAQSVTVSNTGQAALSFSSIAVGGANPGAFTLGGTCSTASPVPAGGSCTVTVVANASGAGPFSGSLALASNASNGQVAVALSGTVSAPAPGIAASPTAVAFGAITIGGAAATQNVTLANTGNVTLQLKGITVSGAAAVTIANSSCGATLAVGANCTVTLAFAPTAEGAASATLAVASNAAQLQVGVTGSGTTAPVAKPALSEAGPLAFPDTQVGSTSAVHTVTLGNSGTAALKIASLVLTGPQAADFVLGGSCAANAVVSPSSSCTIDIGFKPTGAGPRNGMLVLMTDAGSQLTLALGGAGVAVPVPQLTVNPQSFDFGPASVGAAAATHRITITNTGSNPARLTAASFTGPFALQPDSSGCAAFPFTLAPGAACDLVVGFAPVSGGAANGGMTLAAEGGGQLAVAFSGSGNVVVVQAPQNRGGGGCSAITGGDDPMLALLVVVSIGVLSWRRYARKQEPRS